MKKFLFLLLFFPMLSYGCTEYVIGFRGKNNIFDNDAFITYAKMQNKCYKSFAPYQITEANKFIKNIKKSFDLYGYSQGAQSIILLLKDEAIKPNFIITIGAYHSVDVNFDRYNISYQNYFDDSGIGQKSPGIFLKVSHNAIQKEVNKIVFNLKENDMKLGKR